ncbi:MAG: hypothetical protein WCK10_02210 [Candidatus Staskawiczbacteria bacterium]
MKKEMVSPPKNVSGYHVQEWPDCCQNCEHRFLQTVSLAHGTATLACSLSCSNPQKPIYGDPVDPMGICDSHSRANSVVTTIANEPATVEPKGGA